MKQNFEYYLCNLIDNDVTVKQAMNYSLLASGKRVRPLLMLELLKDFGLEPQVGYPVAAAIEFIHTYSLIHDDLPAMDNDDLRRGKPTCHKAFDEATAILAGDGLLTQAFELAASSQFEPSKIVKIISLLARAAGPDGMIRGQCLDLSYEGKTVNVEQLREMDLRKTGEMLTVPLLCGCIIAGREEYLELMKKVGMDIGLAFQIQDDILDLEKSEKELGKSTSDLANNKSTYVSLLSIEGAKKEVDRLFSNVTVNLNSAEMSFNNTLAFISQLAGREY